MAANVQIGAAGLKHHCEKRGNSSYPLSYLFSSIFDFFFINMQNQHTQRNWEFFSSLIFHYQASVFI